MNRKGLLLMESISLLIDATSGATVITLPLSWSLNNAFGCCAIEPNKYVINHRAVSNKLSAVDGVNILSKTSPEVVRSFALPKRQHVCILKFKKVLQIAQF